MRINTIRICIVVNEKGKRYISDIVDEWLETHDEYEEEESILSEIKPYRKRFEDTKISDENDP